MMHRDLKSPNVLLSEEGVAKIADVGMVRAQVQELVTAQPVMTPLWAAPEVGIHLQSAVKISLAIQQTDPASCEPVLAAQQVIDRAGFGQVAAFPMVTHAWPTSRSVACGVLAQSPVRRVV